MLWRNFISSAIVTLVVGTQATDAQQISSYAPSTGAEADIGLGLARFDTNDARLDTPSGVEASYDFFLHRDGFRSLGVNKYEVHTPDETDRWLMFLVGGGLVVLQLRRKQKTLPQRPLIDLENKLFWG